MSINHKNAGLRLMEMEIGLAENVDASSPELVDYEDSRSVGQAARVAMLMKGQDVIEDERHFKKLIAAELSIPPVAFERIKRILQEADLIELRTTRAGKAVIFEKVQRLDFENNYARLGEFWGEQRDRTEKEIVFVETLDSIISAPQPLGGLAALNQLGTSDRKTVLEVGESAAVMDVVETASGSVCYSPLLWDVSPGQLKDFLKRTGHTDLAKLVGPLNGQPGAVLNGSDPIVTQAIRSGILPSYSVVSTGGTRLYSFAPYLGQLLTTTAEKTILDKARALVACLRYGGDAATVSRIRSPLAILERLTDPTRSFMVGPHSELKDQYGMLVKKQLGRVLRQKGSDRYFFQLIDTDDNLRACEIAKELFRTGEVLEGKDAMSAACALHLVAGNVSQPLKEVHVAKKKRSATTDELCGLVQQLQEF